MIYPQLFPGRKEADEGNNKALVLRGQKKTIEFLNIVEQAYLANDYLVGDKPTVADIVAYTVISLSKLGGADAKSFASKYPKLSKYLERVEKNIPGFDKTFAAFHGFAAHLKSQGVKIVDVY